MSNPQPDDPTTTCEHLRGGLGHATLHITPSQPTVTAIVRRAIEDKQVWTRPQLSLIVYRETGVWVKTHMIAKAVNAVDPLRGGRTSVLYRIPFKGNTAHLKPAKEPRRARRNKLPDRRTADSTSGVSGRTAQAGGKAVRTKRL